MKMAAVHIAIVCNLAWSLLAFLVYIQGFVYWAEHGFNVTSTLALCQFDSDTPRSEYYSLMPMVVLESGICTMVFSLSWVYFMKIKQEFLNLSRGWLAVAIVNTGFLGSIFLSYCLLIILYFSDACILYVTIALVYTTLSITLMFIFKSILSSMIGFFRYSGERSAV